MTIVSVMADLANFGAAGLMGALWLWERKLSRCREEQLSDAHKRILRDEQRLESLTKVVQSNTAAVWRFTEIQRQMSQTLQDLSRELRHEHSH